MDGWKKYSSILSTSAASSSCVFMQGREDGVSFGCLSPWCICQQNVAAGWNVRFEFAALQMWKKKKRCKTMLPAACNLSDLVLLVISPVTNFCLLLWVYRGANMHNEICVAEFILPHFSVLPPVTNRHCSAQFAVIDAVFCLMLQEFVYLLWTQWSTNIQCTIRVMLSTSCQFLCPFLSIHSLSM